MVKGLFALSRRLRGKGDPSEELIFRKVLQGEVRAGFQSFPLEEGKPIRLGREPSNDLPIEAESVDGQHAQLKLEKGRVWVKDLGSKNGTRVNGKRVEPRQWIALRSSDRLSLAKQDIALELELEPLQRGQGALDPGRATAILEAGRETAMLEPRRAGMSAPTRRRFEVGLLAGSAVLLVLLLLLIGKSCAKPAPTPPPSESCLTRRLFGNLRLEEGATEATLIVTVPEVPLKVTKVFKVDEEGRYQFDFDLKLKAATTPRKLEIEWQQDGKILGGARDLRLPPPGDSLQLPAPGVDSKT